MPKKHEFKVGDHVEWNSEAGHVRGTIKKKVTSAIKFKTYTVRASKEEPQYLIKSDKTDHMAMHKGAALKKISKTDSPHPRNGQRTRRRNDAGGIMMKENPLLKLEAFGQSIWMDFIRRGMISSGELKQLIEEDGLGGVTSNPSIFEKAIAGSHDYDDAIRALALEGKSIDQIYAALTVEDIQRAADLFRPVYDRLDGADGFVSLEVSPYLAHDTAGTIAEARRLWLAVARPNVMIKVPATAEGLPAIQQLIGEGINVNITLLFGLPRYRQVAEAYIAGLETLAAQGQAPEISGIRRQLFSQSYRRTARSDA